MGFDPIQSLAAARHEFGEHGGVNMSIEASTTFTVMGAEVMPALFQGRLGPEAQRESSGGCYLYGRHFNPTVYVLGRYVAAIEGTEAGYACASGMAAISAAIMQRCSPGHAVVSSNTIYGGTFALLRDFLPVRAGVTTRFVDIGDLDAVQEAMDGDVRVLYTETVSNPTLKVADVPALAEIAGKWGATLIVDNTFTPMIISPAQHGADVVVHSVTKFIGGGSDIIAGAICASTEFLNELMDLHHGALMLLGPTMDPRTAFELSLRLPHLGLRICEHSRRAQLFAERLSERGLAVYYPGLADHPQHGLLDRLRNPGFGFGGILAVDTGSRDRAFRLMEELQNRERFGFMAVSLGYFDTLMSCSAATTSSELGDEALEAAGIPPGLVRMSIGYTGAAEERWDQLERALVRVGLM